MVSKLNYLSHTTQMRPSLHVPTPGQGVVSELPVHAPELIALTHPARDAACGVVLGVLLYIIDDVVKKVRSLRCDTEIDGHVSEMHVEVIELRRIVNKDPQTLIGQPIHLADHLSSLGCHGPKQR